MWIGRTEYVRLCERLARLEAAEEVRRSEQRGDGCLAAAQRQSETAASDAHKLAMQFENLLAYDGTVQTGGERDEET